MKTYKQKLRDPRWQKKRLEIFNRDNWTCLDCKRTDRELHLHHNKYEYGTEPWDYEDNVYETLCYVCHNDEHSDEPELPRNYEHLIIKKEEPDVITSINRQINELEMSLRKPMDDNLMTEILKNIMFLKQQKKELINE